MRRSGFGLDSGDEEALGDDEVALHAAPRGHAQQDEALRQREQRLNESSRPRPPVTTSIFHPRDEKAQTKDAKSRPKNASRCLSNLKKSGDSTREAHALNERLQPTGDYARPPLAVKTPSRH